MEIVEKNNLTKLIADKNKVIILKEKQFNEDGNEIQQVGSKIIYLAINSDPNNYIEVDELEVQ